MFPLIIHIGKLAINFHLITDFISMSVGVWLYWHSAKKDTLSDEKRYLLLIGAGVGALLGSRILGALENPTLFIHPPSLLYYYASKTIIGGIAGGIIGIEITKLCIGHRTSTGDRTTFPLLIAIIIGRIGCFVTGVSDGTAGSVCHYAWCFSQGDGVPRHPTVLYEIIFLVALATLLKWLQKKPLQSGTLFRAFVVFYFALRFFIEFLKPIMPLAFGLSATQIVCLIFAAWYTYDILARENLFYGKRNTTKSFN